MWWAGAWVGAVVAACGAGERLPAGYVGLTYPPLPEGLASAGARPFPTGPFALDLVFGTDRQMVWLTRGTEGAREVVAVLEVPQSEQNVQLVYTPGACRVAGAVHPEILALVRFQFAPELDDVVLAWRADRETGRFVPLDSAVVCRNPRVAG